MWTYLSEDGHVACIGAMISADNFGTAGLKEYHFGGLDKRIILKWILKIWCVGVDWIRLA